MSGARAERRPMADQDDDRDEQQRDPGDESGARGDGEGQGQELSVERRARMQGWKPLEEFGGPRDQWRSAEDYLARADNEMPLLRSRLRAFEGRIAALDRRLAESGEVIGDMSERLRSADERAIKRARAELEAKRREAVQSADTEAFDAAEQELAELEESRQKPRGTNGAAPAGQGANSAPLPPPEVLAWAKENPWFHSDPALRSAATAAHVALLSSEPTLSLAENLDKVSRTMAALHPDRVRAPRRNRDEDERDDRDDEGERRRHEPAAVTPNRERPARRRDPRSFDAMPQESKDAYAKYARQIADKPMGKGKPLTKDEWAKDYWAQWDE